MTATIPKVEICLRIPGKWEHPKKLLENMPQGYRLSAEALIMPDGTEIEFNPLPPDDMFPKIFAQSCRTTASAAEMEIVNSYTVNVGLIDPGGSLATAPCTIPLDVSVSSA